MAGNAQKRKANDEIETRGSKRVKTSSKLPKHPASAPSASSRRAILRTPLAGPDKMDASVDNDKPVEVPKTSKKGKEKAVDRSNVPQETVSKKRKHKVKKLVPPRPFPTVPASVSATGPRSAHHEGKNYIAITRKTPLGAYLRRCKDVILKDG